MIRRFLCTVALAVLCLVSSAAPAAAFDVYNPSGNGVNCSGAQASSAVCQSKLGGGQCSGPASSQPAGCNPISGSDGLLIKITNIVAIIAGAAAVIVIIVGGIKYITAGGDPNKAAEARKAVINALVGLLIIVLARTIIAFVIKHI